jgi:hypothetical protein
VSLPRERKANHFGLEGVEPRSLGVKGDLAQAVQGKFEALEEFFAAIEGPFAAAVERVEIRKAGALESVQAVPAQREARIEWLAQEWPPKILGEVCGAIGFGLYDEAQLGKS